MSRWNYLVDAIAQKIELMYIDVNIGYVRESPCQVQEAGQV